MQPAAKDAPEWREVIAPTQMRIASPDGAYIVRLPANVVVRVHPEVFHAALAAGCSLPGGHAGQELPHEDIVLKLETAMREILASGREDRIMKNGEPRYAALKNAVGVVFTDEQRAEAWANVFESVTNPAQAD